MQYNACNAMHECNARMQYNNNSLHLRIHGLQLNPETKTGNNNPSLDSAENELGLRYFIQKHEEWSKENEWIKKDWTEEFTSILYTQPHKLWSCLNKGLHYTTCVTGKR